MEITLSSKGQLVLPARVRRQLRLARGERLSIEVRGDSVILRPVSQPRRYRTALHPVSGLPVMVALERPARKVSAAEIARLSAELL
jgi:AbrB family looped-hinge helix DNA binding protein